MKVALLAFVSICLSVGAQFMLRAGMTRVAEGQLALPTSSLRSLLGAASEPLVLGGLGLYALGAVVWLLVLAKWEVSRAYPLVGLGFVLTAIVGLLVGENLTLIRLLGISMIAAGVILVGQS